MVDRTGLTQLFDVELQFTRGAVSLQADTLETGPAFLTALTEQLGLKLEPSRASVEALVIDRVEPPTPN